MTPLVKFKKALETLTSHNKTQYHKNAYSKAVAFIEYMSGKHQSVAVQFNSVHAAKIQTNRKILKSIMATVEVCGRQAIPLRGHEDVAKYNNTGILCVCLSVCCPTWDIRNRRSHHHAAYTILKSFTWRVAQAAFRAYTTSGSREKAFGSFLPVTCRIPCMHSYTSSYPGQDECCPIQENQWNILEGYGLNDTPSTSREP